MSTESPESVEEASRMVWAHKKPLCGAISVIIRDPHLVEDTFSDVIIQVIKQWCHYDRERPFLPWGLKIARHAAYRVLRSEARQPVSDESIELVAETIAVESNQSYDEEQFAALRRCVSLLRSHHRELVSGRYYANRKVVELSAASGKSVGALYCVFGRLHTLLGKCVRRELDNR